MPVPLISNQGAFQPNGSDASVTMAQQELEKTMNRGTVTQMQTMAKQAQQQTVMTQIGAVKDLMNSTKEQVGQIRL